MLWMTGQGRDGLRAPLSSSIALEPFLAAFAVPASCQGSRQLDNSSSSGGRRKRKRRRDSLRGASEWRWCRCRSQLQDGANFKTSAFADLHSCSYTVLEQIMGKAFPAVDWAMVKLRAVTDEQRREGPGKRLALYLVPPTGGAVAFGATLIAAQAAGAAAGVSCASPVLASLMGCMAVGGASAASAQVSYTLRKYCEQKPLKQEVPFLSKDSLLVRALFGIILYKVLGGRYHNLMPSNVVNPGALARASIPARGRKYANKVEQGLIQDLYRKHGCHHCGKRTGISIADHMPPNVVAHGRGWAKSVTPTKDRSFLARLASTIPLPALPSRVILQRFYPQCTDCTNLQSTALRHGKKSLVFHFRRGIPEAPYFTGFCIGAMPLDDWNTVSAGDKKRR